MLHGQYSDDPAAARSAAGIFLLADPVANNVILTLLEQRTVQPEPGNYWWVTNGDEVVGFAMQSPITFKAILAPTSREVLDVLVEIIFGTAPFVPGIVAEATTAALFAGRWTERAGTGAIPVEGQRIYVLGSLRPPHGVDGKLRFAATDDLDTLVAWHLGFSDDTGTVPEPDPRAVSRQLLESQRLWIWESGGVAVSMARATRPVARVSRIGYVYSPPEHRRRGYAAAIVSAISKSLLDAAADVCMLYTQLSNPTSNAIYRRIGYEARLEVLSFGFG